MAGAGFDATVNFPVPGVDPPSIVLILTSHRPILAVRGMAIEPVILVVYTQLKVAGASTFPEASWKVTLVCPGMKLVPTIV